MNEMTDNPDYRLVMDFLQSINPGDMGEESAEQLMQIGQRIEGGGQLSDQEREMFMSVVGAMPDMRARTGAAMTEADLMPDMRAQTGAAMTEAEMEELRMREFNRKLQKEQQFAFDARQRQLESGNLPTGEAAGMVEVPQMESPRPRMRPEGLGMQSPRPRMRPDNLGG